MRSLAVLVYGHFGGLRGSADAAGTTRATPAGARTWRSAIAKDELDSSLDHSEVRAKAFDAPALWRGLGETPDLINHLAAIVDDIAG